LGKGSDSKWPLHGKSTLSPGERELLAAAFSMLNRYVYGLGTCAPQEKEAYIEMGQNPAKIGYVENP
jgi:hypothetical protein